MSTHRHDPSAPAHACCGGGAATPTDAATRDPVCGMVVDPASSPHSAEHDGKTYWFCSAGCRTKFLAEPARYLAPQPATAPVGAKQEPAGTLYTCPMHPQIRQVGPGSCPLCGMALEPEAPALDDGPNPELADMTRRFWIALALTLPVFVTEMGAHLLGLTLPWGDRANAWMQLALASPVVLWAGWPFFQRGWASILARSLNMFTLVALGTGTAYLYSLVATLAPQLMPSGFQGHHGQPPVYFEAAAVITVLVLLGQILELRARDRTGGAIRALLNLSPRTARRIGEDGQDVEVGIDEIKVGDRLRIRPGEKAPVDGVVLEGRGYVDEALVTGESMPVLKEPGSTLVGGAINKSGGLVMRADRVGSDTLLARIVAMVAQAQRSRASIQRLADRVSAWFVPIVLAAAVLAFAGWALAGPEPRLSHALVAAVGVLIIACPCALGLATPMSIMVGVGRGAQAGVLLKDAEALERLERIDALVIDKTGTLTEGRPALTDVKAIGLSPDDLLTLAASLERGSEHPLGRAVVEAAKAKGLSLSDVSDFDSPVGKGVTGLVDGRRVAIGGEPYMGDLGVAVEALADGAKTQRGQGATVVFVAVDGKAAGALAITDPIRESSRAAIESLRREGIRLIMMTGDNRVTAEAVAKALGIDEVEAGVLPERKAQVVERLKSEGFSVAMAGDGVNDAPALAAADVGIAMGAGADVAM
ncbi:MAG: heavy metal translocating P-type ATPase, partial [Alphaproteobacteria bacterium]|nr:heavy metal translocating P-type ATPase [Alphaproteobacteria bacterium]